MHHLPQPVVLSNETVSKNVVKRQKRGFIKSLGVADNIVANKNNIFIFS